MYQIKQKDINMEAKKKAIIVSGYFNPIHKGHLELLELATQNADKVWVIVNSDKQRELKGSDYFMDEDERLQIVKAIRYVDYALISQDTDKTQCETLKQFSEMFGEVYDLAFANGGDQTNDTIPEAGVCKECGIELIDGLGVKIQSSSWLLK
jgi:cytidyltransferase-like protein|tara:strand:+ start:153 stop:608 length:456 start_codon:yes stop_codon:yes gene_type:complete